MSRLYRRGILAAAGSAALSAAAEKQGAPEPVRGAEGTPVAGPTNSARQAQEPFTTRLPRTDRGTMPNLKWSSTNSHMRLEEGGWARQTTVRELGVSKTWGSRLAGLRLISLADALLRGRQA